MTKNGTCLVPISIVDRFGRQTNVHKKPLDGLRAASEAFPVSLVTASHEKLRERLVESILGMLRPRERRFMSMELLSLHDDVLRDAKRLLESPHAGLVVDLSGIISRIASGETDPSVLKLFADKSDLLTPEFGFDGMYRLYFELSTRYRDAPVTGEQLTAHSYVAQHYDVTSRATGTCIQTSDGTLSYYGNRELMDFVTRHPDKAEIIVRHRETYRPEQNGFDQMEADLEKLSELSNAISDGWL